MYTTANSLEKEGQYLEVSPSGLIRQKGTDPEH